MLIRMVLAQTIIYETSESQVIILKEQDGERHLPIMIGINEALAIDRRLKRMETPRPLTHELMADIIEELDADLEKIIINDLREGTFFAKLVLRSNGQLVEIDARPSDAIALGVGDDVSFFVESHVLDEANKGL